MQAGIRGTPDVVIATVFTEFIYRLVSFMLPRRPTNIKTFGLAMIITLLFKDKSSTKLVRRANDASVIPGPLTNTHIISILIRLDDLW